MLTPEAVVLDAVWKVGDVVGVLSVGGDVTMVSLDADGGSWSSLACTLSEATAGACSFILALVLVGGMYTVWVPRVQQG
jgi:hypothetical protein